MRSGKAAAAALVAGLALGAGGAEAGPIEQACRHGGRSGATPQLCQCIQRVADTVLARREQRLAARFFADPHQAQVMRQSGRDAHRVFWQRYKYFGAAAEMNCRRG